MEKAVTRRELFAKEADRRANDLMREAALPLGIMSQVKREQAMVLRGVAAGLRADVSEGEMNVMINPRFKELVLRVSVPAGEQPEY